MPPENDTTSMTVEEINNGSDGTTENSNSVVNNQKKGNEVRFEDDTIHTIFRSRERFSKRDQLKSHQVRRMQHVAAFPAKITLFWSFGANFIKNKPLTPIDVEISEDMLGRSKHLSTHVSALS